MSSMMNDTKRTERYKNKKSIKELSYKRKNSQEKKGGDANASDNVSLAGSEIKQQSIADKLKSSLA